MSDKELRTLIEQVEKQMRAAAAVQLGRWQPIPEEKDRRIQLGGGWRRSRIRKSVDLIGGEGRNIRCERILTGERFLA